MQNAIIASLYYVSDYHERCLKTNDTWCQFQKDKIDGIDLYKNKHGLPIDIRKEILPIYHALTKPEAEEMFARKNSKCKRVVQWDDLEQNPQCYSCRYK